MASGEERSLRPSRRPIAGVWPGFSPPRHRRVGPRCPLLRGPSCASVRHRTRSSPRRGLAAPLQHVVLPPTPWGHVNAARPRRCRTPGVTAARASCGRQPADWHAGALVWREYGPVPRRLRRARGFCLCERRACTYANKMQQSTGIEMAEVIPGFTLRFDVQELVKCIAPRKTLLVSATEDPYSYDAEAITQVARETFAALGAVHNLEHKQYSGGHALTQERFDDIIAWIIAVCRA